MLPAVVAIAVVLMVVALAWARGSSRGEQGRPQLPHNGGVAVTGKRFHDETSWWPVVVDVPLAGSGNR